MFFSGPRAAFSKVFYGQHFRFRASEEGYCEDFKVSKDFIE
jgi:hypothetical protein